MKKLVFLLVMFSLIIFSNAQSIDDLISSGLENIVEEDFVDLEPEVCGTEECFEEHQRREEARALDELRKLDCGDDQLCKIFRDEAIYDVEETIVSEEIEIEEIEPAVVSETTEVIKEKSNSAQPVYPEIDNSVPIIVGVQDDETVWEKLRRIFKALNKYVSFEFTGNVVYEDLDTLDLPGLPEQPGSIDAVNNPKLSRDKVKIFNFLTGNAIIGIPDWSFDGTDEENGNFLFRSSYIASGGNVQHFDLSLNINWSKNDLQGRGPVNGIVFNQGYYLNTKNEEWVNFSWDGTQIWSRDSDGENKDTGWLRSAEEGQPIPSASLTLEDHTDDDYTVFLGYSCLKFFEQSWHCNEGKWVIYVVETGSVNYHVDIEDVPALEFEGNVADLDISDLPSVLEQFNATLKSFQPDLNDILIVENIDELSGDIGNIVDLQFHIKNLGNKRINKIDYELDIGERSLIEVVNVDLPNTLEENETKIGTVSLLLKEEHQQKITLWARTDLEVDTSDNNAEFQIFAGDKTSLYNIPDRVPYHGNNGEVISVRNETFLIDRSYDENLEVKSGTDLVRTIYGGYFDDLSINPTMQLYVNPVYTFDIITGEPFVNSIFMGGDMLTGDREPVEFKVRITNVDSGEYYDTQNLESQFKYFFNPKELIPNFEFCTDYISEVIWMDGTEETIDVILPKTFNLCSLSTRQTIGNFKTRRIVKNDRNFVVVIPQLIPDYYDTLDLGYLLEFSSFRDSNPKFYTPHLNVLDGPALIPVEDIFGNRNINYNVGERFYGLVHFLDPVSLRRTNCLTYQNGKALSGISNSVGVENWEDLDYIDSLRYQASESLLCYDDLFYQCGYQNIQNLEMDRVSNNDVVGNWQCRSNRWSYLDDPEGIVETEEVTITYNQTKIDIEGNGQLYVYRKGIFAHIDGDIVFDTPPLTFAAFDQTIEDTSGFILGENINSLENDVQAYLDYYLICRDCEISISYKNISEVREVGIGNRTNLVFSIPYHDYITVLTSELVLKNGDKFTFYSHPDDRGFHNFKSPTGPIFYLFGIAGMQEKTFSRILNRTNISMIVYDLTDKRIMNQSYIDVGLSSPPSKSFSDYYDGWENGHFYEVYLQAEGEDSDLFEPYTKKMYYIDGFSFMMNNRLLYSQFLGLSNSMTRYKSGYIASDANSIPTVTFFQSAANTLYNHCTGEYEKRNASLRYIDYLDCYPLHTTPGDITLNRNVPYEGGLNPLFSEVKISITPLEESPGITRRRQFNCKIGRFDGVCYRSNYGLYFSFLDDRTSLFYEIYLRDEDNRFLIKYRDASSLGTQGNRYDLALYDILTQIDLNPIVDFELDFTYTVPQDTVRSTRLDLIGGFAADHRNITLPVNGEYSATYKLPEYYPINNENTTVVVYNSSFDIVARFNRTNDKNADIRQFDYQNKFLHYMNPLSLDDGYYYIINKGYSYLFKIPHIYWVSDVTNWFFSDNDLVRFSDVPDELNASYVFHKLPLVKYESTPYKSHHYKFHYFYEFVIDPVDWHVGDFTSEEYSGFFEEYYNNDITTIKDKLEPTTFDQYGGASRTYSVRVLTYDDFYKFVKDAPKNCQNIVSGDDDFLRDVVCTGGVSGDRFNRPGWGAPSFNLRCSWANIDKMEVYEVAAKETYHTKTYQDVLSLPEEIKNEMKEEFLDSLMAHYIELLPPTPILNTSYGTIEDVLLGNEEFCS